MRSPLFFAHIRAAIGSAVQQTNCHPFRHGRWLWMHNGFVDGFAAIKRDLVLAVDEPLFPEIKGQADTEVLFYLALTFGLQDDPPEAVARAIGLVEACGRRRGVTYPFQGTIATTDGESLWAFRYSSEGKSRSLFINRDVPALRQQYPDRQGLEDCPTTRGSSSPNRSVTCPAPGSRCPRQATGWLPREVSSSCPSPRSPRRRPYNARGGTQRPCAQVRHSPLVTKFLRPRWGGRGSSCSRAHRAQQALTVGASRPRWPRHQFIRAAHRCLRGRGSGSGWRHVRKTPSTQRRPARGQGADRHRCS